MLIDNAIGNAMAASAKNITVRVSQDVTSYILEFIDDGNGLSEKQNNKDLFNIGVSTSSGRGIGLN